MVTFPSTTLSKSMIRQIQVPDDLSHRGSDGLPVLNPFLDGFEVWLAWINGDVEISTLPITDSAPNNRTRKLLVSYGE